MSKLPGDQDQEDQSTLEKNMEINGDDFDFPLQEEVRKIEQDSAIDKVHQRITVLAILIPCLLGALVLYVYLDVKEHVAEVRHVGSAEVKELSEDVVDKVSSVSDQQRELTKSLSNRITTLEASAVDIKQRIAKQLADTKRIGESKVDKESLGKIEEQTADTIKRLEALQQGLDAQKRAIEKLDATFKEEMAGLSRTVKTIKGERKEQASAVKKLSDSKLDKATFDKFLKKETEGYESAMAPLKKEMDALREGIAQLHKRVNRLGRSLQLLEAERALSESTSSQATPAGDVGEGPGKIIEQEIAE